jgi:phage tail protein X
MAMTSSQKTALNTDQFIAFTNLGTPLVLDLNNNGINTQSIEKGVKFDIFGTGQDVQTGWVSGGDGLLVMDRNHDGSINGGAELFGEGTTLANGQKASNGYAALSELDANSDGSISAADKTFSDLMVWVDGNSDGVSQAGELHSLSSLGIASLDLKAQGASATDNGNLIGLTSNYTTTDGQTHEMADVWFATKAVAPATPAVATVTQLAPPAISLVLPDAAPTPTAVVTAIVTAPPATDLRAQVGTLVDAMQAFNSGAAAGSAGAGTQMASLTAPVTVAPAASLGVVNMVDALKQFDANGKPILGSSATPSATTVTLNTSLLPKTGTDILAPSK